MYEITTESNFSAAHSLRDYGGPCENLHGHNWVVRATVRCQTLDKCGLGIDFKALRGKLRDILDAYDHKNLNDVFDVIGESPSSEYISRHIYRRLAVSLDGTSARLVRVEVQETPGNSAAYYE